MEPVMLMGMVFGLRVVDVSLGTLRHIFAVQGRSALAAGLGFFEMLIFLIALSRVLGSVQENAWLALAYGGGFAAGTWLGVTLEERLALGIRMIRVITTRPNDELVVALRDRGFGVTVLRGEGLNGPVHVLMSIMQRCRVSCFKDIVRDISPQAFLAIEETRFASGGTGMANGIKNES